MRAGDVSNIFIKETGLMELSMECEDGEVMEVVHGHLPPANAAVDLRKGRKAVFRRTIDYNSSVINFLKGRVCNFSDQLRSLQPDPLWSPMWTPEGRRLITGAYSGEFTLWNGLTFNFETILQAHESQIRCMKWSNNDEWLLTADHHGYVKYWQANMNNVEMYQAHKEPIRGVSFCPFDSKFVTCSDDSTVRIWDFHRCTEERVLRGHGSDVRSVAWHPVLSVIISGSKDAQQPIKLWDPKGGDSIATLYVHKNTCTDVAWNPNGNWFLTASRDHLIKLFDLRNLKTELQTFRGHKKDVMRVAWHPFHEGVFASGSADGSIFYWAAGTETELGAVENAHESMIWSLAWHPLGHILVSGANDFATKFWTRSRPGDAPKESLSGAMNEGLLNSTNIHQYTTMEQDSLDNAQLTSDLLRSLCDATAAKIALESVDEVAFTFNVDDIVSAVEIPGLNDGLPVANLNLTDADDGEERDKSKVRGSRMIPKEFVANWASTRITAMPSAMMQALPDTTALAAAVMSNFPSTMQYLPPVKPTLPAPVSSESDETPHVGSSIEVSNKEVKEPLDKWAAMNNCSSETKSDRSMHMLEPLDRSEPPPDYDWNHHSAPLPYDSRGHFDQNQNIRHNKNEHPPPRDFHRDRILPRMPQMEADLDQRGRPGEGFDRDYPQHNYRDGRDFDHDHYGPPNRFRPPPHPQVDDRVRQPPPANQHRHFGNRPHQDRGDRFMHQAPPVHPDDTNHWDRSRVPELPRDRPAPNGRPPAYHDSRPHPPRMNYPPPRGGSFHHHPPGIKRSMHPQDIDRRSKYSRSDWGPNNHAW